MNRREKEAPKDVGRLPLEAKKKGEQIAAHFPQRAESGRREGDEVEKKRSGAWGLLRQNKISP